MIPYKELQKLNKRFLITIDKWDGVILTLKPTQFWQLLFTEEFIKDKKDSDIDYLCLEWWGSNHGGCYNPRIQIIDKFNIK